MNGDEGSLLVEVSHDEAKMRERRESLSFLSFLPRRERPLLAGNDECCMKHETILQSLVFFFQKIRELLSRHVLRVYQGPLATSKAITAKSVTLKNQKSLRFSTFFNRDYFNSLKTSNIIYVSFLELNFWDRTHS